MILLIVNILVVSILGGCKKEEEVPSVQVSKMNSVFTDIVKEAGIDNLAVVVDMPNENLLGKIQKLDTYGEEDVIESFVMIPMYNGTKVQLVTVAYENDTLVPKQVVYEKLSSEEGYGLYVRAIRPEGAPQLKLSLEYEGRSAEYIITYNGKDGTPQYEYISQTPNRQREDSNKPDEDIFHLDSELIAPIQDDDYVEGLNLIYSYTCDIDNDSNDETIDVYCAAERDGTGNLMLDDGQEWSVILQKENDAYPLFERSYVQLGEVSYSAYESYDDNKFHILITNKQGASIIIYDCYYDKEAEELRREMVYQSENINMISSFN